MNVIAHNLLAMNANRQFNITNKKLVSGIVLGYKDEYPDKRPRKEFNDVVTFM